MSKRLAQCLAHSCHSIGHGAAGDSDSDGRDGSDRDDGDDDDAGDGGGVDKGGGDSDSSGTGCCFHYLEEFKVLNPCCNLFRGTGPSIHVTIVLNVSIPFNLHSPLPLFAPRYGQ